MRKLIILLLLAIASCNEGNWEQTLALQPYNENQLSSHKDWRVRAEVAKKSQNQEILEQLAQDSSSSVRAVVAKNSSISPKICDILARDTSWYVQRSLAQNPKISLENVERLSTSGEPEVLIAVAENPATPTNILKKIIETADSWQVVSRISQHPKAPVATLLSCYQKKPRLWKHQIATGLAQNPTGFHNFIQTIEKNKLWGVKRQIGTFIAQFSGTHEKVLEMLSRMNDWDISCAIIRNPKTTVPILKAIIQDGEEDIRVEIASCVNTPGEILEILAKDSSVDVRSEVASNPQTPKNVLQKLSEDDDDDVKEAALEALEEK